MPLSRRDFLRASSVLASAAPPFWQRVARAAPADKATAGQATVLVVVQLSGGNDGLNTIIPFRDELYAQARPTLRQPTADIRRINDDVAFHPALAGFSRLLDDGRLAVVQGVGYPNPNRSHFYSMDVWHKGTLSAAEPFGWLGRTSERFAPGEGTLQVGPGESPLALAGPSRRSVSLQSLADYQLKVSLDGDDPARRRLIEGYADRPSDNPALALVQESARESYRSSARLRDVARNHATPTIYPAGGLAQHLKLVAQLLAAGVPDRVFYISMGGFDTHAAQAAAHGSLLRELGDALAAFQEDLVHLGQAERVLTVTFSEFGRRVKENGSAGTDHGAASQMFLIGPAVQPGVHGAHPSLSDLDDGDLKFHTDFRRVYATLLDGWLKVNSREVLGETHERLALLKQA